jgi:hypothetical protein
MPSPDPVLWFQGLSDVSLFARGKLAAQRDFGPFVSLTAMLDFIN